MASLTSKLCFRVALFIFVVSVLAHGENSLSCDTSSPEAFGYRCSNVGMQDQCNTFAMLRTNAYFSSLSNLSLYLGIDKKLVSEASGFSTSTEFLPKDQPLLISIDCRCNKGLFEALLKKTSIKGESFYGIAESLEGLSTCKAIQRRNPSLSPWGLQDKVQVLIPLRCVCTSQLELKEGTQFALSYPIKEGDTVASLAFDFNISIESILSSNNKSEKFKSEKLEPFSTILIPLKIKPILAPFAIPREPYSGFPATGIPVTSPPKHHSRKPKMRKIGVYIALSSIIVGISVAVFAVFLVYRLRKQKPDFCKSGDVELQHLSIRTRSEIKTISESSQDPFDTHTVDTTPHKLTVETYTIEEMKKATEKFSSSNFIEGTVFHGRLNGKNMAIKRAPTESISKIDFELFHEAYRHNSGIIRLLGTCMIDGPDSFLVFEYAKNGSLKDWLHGGLAMKSQFIASCYCFLTWNQRVKICLDIATALEYMHHIMHPSYVHRNIKSRNIYLDEEFNAKIGNFGMARCTEENSEDVRNRGYFAPEYLEHGTISSSIDIFAYGVVLLEVLSGQPPVIRDDKKGEATVLLSDKIKNILQVDDFEPVREWMDNALGDAYSFDMAITLANLARACVEEDPSCRPSAGEIVQKLSKLVKELPGEQSLSRTSSSKPQEKGSCKHLIA